MKAPIVTTKNLYLQKDFASWTELWLKGLFGAADKEKLLCAVWISPLTRQGFLLTDRGLRWYLPGEEAPISGLLLHEIAPHADFAVSGSEAFLRIEITAAGGSYAFFFKNLAEEKGRTLCDILRFGYLQGTVPQVDLSVLIKNMPCTAFRNRLDGALLALAALPEKRKRKAKAAAARQEQASGAQGQEKTENAAAAVAGAETAAGRHGAGPGPDADCRQGDQAEATDAARSYLKKRRKALKEKAAFIALSMLDLLAGLLFVAAVVIAIKPELLAYAIGKVTPPELFRSFCWQGEYFKLFVFGVPQLEDAGELLIWRNLFVVAALAVYVLLKLFVALHSKNNGNKIVSVLMIAMSILACSLVADKALIFIAFCLLIYIAFEYSCGLRTRIVFTKLLVLIGLAVIGYFAAHILLDSGCRLLLVESIQRFFLPGIRWL